MDAVKGYKVFESDWTCRGYQYEVGKIFEEDVVPECCERGFHFCINLVDCFGYYSFNPQNKVAEVIALGDVVTSEEGDKCCTNKIQIVRELSWEEVLRMVNTGEQNTGRCNTGNGNSGDYNSGNGNSGSWNTGNRNSGNWNVGHSNAGDYNAGDRNIGHCNIGDCNFGDKNVGDGNHGHGNHGLFNSGSQNRGSYNVGHRNSGSYNRGCCNYGDWNKANYAVGGFNTVSSTIMLFNKTSDLTLEQWEIFLWENPILNLMPKDTTLWIPFKDMSEEEKLVYPTAVTTGGYLKQLTQEEVRLKRQRWWDNMSIKDQDYIKSIPNFDADIFEEITGIKVE